MRRWYTGRRGACSADAKTLKTCSRASLVIAKNGPKLKPTDELEPPHFGPGIRGKSSLDELAQYLTQFVIAFSNLGSVDGERNDELRQILRQLIEGRFA